MGVLSPPGGAVLESIKGEEAARLFTDHTGIRPRGDAMAFLRDVASGLSRFPYENISKIIKSADCAGPRESMRLPDEVVADHIRRNFGGTCFSLTFLLERMLTALGFDCYKVMADMRSGTNVHCLVVVRGADAKCIIDPGYALSEVVELPRRGRVTVEFPHALVNLDTDDGKRFNLWTEDASGQKWRYAFTDEPVGEDDFEAHWVSSFDKPTLRNICLTMMTTQGHIYFRKDFFKFTSQRTITKRKLKHDIERFIQEEFGIAGEWTDLARKALEEVRARSWQK